MLGKAAYLWVAALAASRTSVLAQSTPDNSTADNAVPQVQLDQGTFNGVRNGSVDKFLGIQYAKPTSVHTPFERFLLQQPTYGNTVQMG